MDFKSLLDQLNQLSEAKEETKTGVKHKAKPGRYGGYDPETNPDKDDDEKKAEPAAKRGRGRPKKDADSDTGEVKKWDTDTLQRWIVGSKPADFDEKEGTGTKYTKMASAEKAVSAYNKMREQGKSHSEALEAAAEKYDISQSTLNRYIEDEKLDDVAPPGKKAKRMVKNIKKGFAKDGKVTPKKESVAEGADKNSSLKDWMKVVSENVPSGMKPLAVMNPQNRQVGAGVLTSKNPAVQNMLGGIDPREVQIVQTTAQTSTQPAAGATGQAPTGTQPMKEKEGDYSAKRARAGKDIGKPGKQFSKIATSAGKRYGSKAAGERVAGAVLKNLRKANEGVSEASKKIPASNKPVKPEDSYVSLDDVPVKKPRGHKQYDPAKEFPGVKAFKKEGMKEGKFVKGPGGVPSDRYGNPIEPKPPKGVGAVTLRQLEKNKRENPGQSPFKTQDEKVKKYLGLGEQDVAEGYILKKTNVEKTFHPGDPDDFGSVDMTRKDTDYEIINNKTGQVVGTASWTTNDYFGPGAIKITMKNGATRYLDIKNSDKGNPQSAFNRFVKDPSTSKKYKEQGVAEADIPSDQMDMGAGLGAGRSDKTFEGKKAKPDFLDIDKDKNKKESMKKAASDKKKKKVTESSHRHSAARLMGKSHALAKEGYNCRYEDMDEAREYHEGFKEGLDECYGQGVYETAPAMPPATVSGMASAAMPTLEDEMDMYEMDRTEYMRHKASTTPGDTFKAFGQTFNDTEVLETDSFFESLDNQLQALLESEQVDEGMTVSISKGQQGMPDSVSVTAQDAEAEQLLGLIKTAGLGLFGDQQSSDYGIADQGTESHGDIEVVGDHDGMMSIMKKLTGQTDSQDYADEEGEDEETCDSCGEPESDCGCDHEEQVDEVENDEQREFQVSEDNPPDTDAAETTADEEAEAAEDQALATQNVEEELNEWANDAGQSLEEFKEETFTTDDEFMIQTIAGGLNKPKSTGQTTIPVIAGQNDRMGYSTNESIGDWKKLAGIR